MRVVTSAHPLTGELAGMTVTVDTRRQPRLVLEYVGGGRLRLRLDGESLLWARVELDYSGVWLLRREPPEPLRALPPISGPLARSTSDMEAWMKWVARELSRGHGSPIRGGVWQLTELRPLGPGARTGAGPSRSEVHESQDPDGLPCAAYGLRQALQTPAAGFHEWGISGSGAVVPLRHASTADAARVRSWRKHAREGTLPPVVLWWVGALDMHLLIDGHDRLQAAAIEGIAPSAITIWQPLEAPWEEPVPWRDELVRRYEKAFGAGDRLSDGSRRQLNHSLVEAYRGWRRAVTTARAKPGLGSEWLREVRAQLHGDAALGERMCGPSRE